MLQTQETPAGGAAGASRDNIAGVSLHSFSLEPCRAQFLNLAAAAFGGGRP